MALVLDLDVVDRDAALLDQLDALVGRARELGAGETTSLFTGGCADSGFAAATGAPTICGVGPVGGKAHSPEEFLEIETLVPRAQALALAVLRLP